MFICRFNLHRIIHLNIHPFFFLIAHLRKPIEEEKQAWPGVTPMLESRKVAAAMDVSTSGADPDFVASSR
jgi:hypothetical protein